MLERKPQMLATCLPKEASRLTRFYLGSALNMLAKAHLVVKNQLKILFCRLWIAVELFCTLWEDHLYMVFCKHQDPCLANCQRQAVVLHPLVYSYDRTYSQLCHLDVPRGNEGLIVRTANEARLHGHVSLQQTLIRRIPQIGPQFRSFSGS